MAMADEFSSLPIDMHGKAQGTLNIPTRGVVSMIKDVTIHLDVNVHTAASKAYPLALVCVARGISC
jgi:hypothetical protein